MNKNLIVFIVVIILLFAFVGFVLLRNNANGTDNTNLQDTTGNTEVVGTPPASDQTKNIVTVTYNGVDFNPNTVTIKMGDSVTFVKQSSGGMEVASNPHPTHTDYPEFDQGDGPQKGNVIYVFVFGRTGTWGYHDHTNPSAKGTIIVTP